MISSVFLFDRRLITRFDWVLFFITLLIVSMGIFNLYSAGSSINTSIILFKKQLYWLALGIFLLFVGAFLNHSHLEQYCYPFYLLTIFLIILVLFHGKLVSGSRRWISLGLFNIQPSELVKLSLIMVLSRWFSKNYNPSGLGLPLLVIPFILLFIPTVFIFLQPDLGTSLVLILIFLSIVLFVKIRLWSLFLLFFCAICVSPFSWGLLKDYQKERIVHFLNPGLDPLGRGYQILQSKIAIGSGGLWGRGFLRGTQTQLDFVPEKYTDFVFSVFCEEWGFVGAFFLVLLYVLLLIRFLNIVSNAKNSFGLLLGYGIIALFFWQVIINMGMVVGLLPTVGIPLPLFSYGGSSFAISMFSIGVLINIHIQRHIF